MADPRISPAQDRVAKMLREGVTKPRAIAAMTGVSTQRVYAILKRLKEKEAEAA